MVNNSRHLRWFVAFSFYAIILNAWYPDKKKYRNDPKFLDRYARANSADPVCPGKQCGPRSDCSKRSSLIRVYTVCNSLCIVWTHYSMVEPDSSNFRVITTNVRIFRKFTVVFWYVITRDQIYNLQHSKWTLSYLRPKNKGRNITDETLLCSLSLKQFLNILWTLLVKNLDIYCFIINRLQTGGKWARK